MKLFRWMQSMINSKPNHVPPAPYHRKEETEIEECRVDDSADLTEFTAEEVGRLQKELIKLVSRKPASTAEDLPLDRFLNCPSSLDVDRSNSSSLSTDSDSNCDYDEEEIDRTIRAIIGRCKDVCEKSQQMNPIGKKSLPFLLKKVFICRSGFAPTPSLRDTFQESRMEKLLRTMLSKRVYSESMPRGSSMERYLEEKKTSKGEEEEEKWDKTCDSGRWDKSDSEFIVLEI